VSAAAAPPSSPLWAITAYFNPTRSRYRRANYRLFRAHLRLPLLAVELAFDGCHELGRGDADILVQLRGGDVMWQKERLLNVALRHLPADCRHVAWVDCDALFDDGDWAERLLALLDRHPLVQAFSSIAHLGPPAADAGAATAFTQPGVLARVAAAGVAAVASPLPSGPSSPSKGFAWAAHREVLDAFSLYDACIVGGGDMAFACALLGRFDVGARTMNERQREHYLRWARPFHDALAGRAGVLAGAARHLWHGDVRHRRYRERHDGLHAHGFDPFADIAVAADGAWRWSSAKPGLHAYVRDYFASRREE
jgi:hypothetical protein